MGLFKAVKKLAKHQAERRKKMEAEKPRSARSDQKDRVKKGKDDRRKKRNREMAKAAGTGAAIASLTVGGNELMKAMGRAEQKKRGIKPSDTPMKKANGGLASAAKTITSGTTRSRNKTKPRGVGVATRGYGKALK